jgi:AmiR/NasT family two-component response regulator
MDYKDQEQQRLRNQVQDLQKIFARIDLEKRSAMQRTKKIGVLGIIVTGISIGVSAYLAIKFRGG